MKKTVKKKWVEALRSGKYRQGRGYLRSTVRTSAVDGGGGYCCLGVLCDIYRKETGKGKWRRASYGETYSFEADGGQRSDCFPPQAVIEWAGLELDNPILAGVAASELNDGDLFPVSDDDAYMPDWQRNKEHANLDFNFIATLIETEL
jgi:hypothetical protein